MKNTLLVFCISVVSIMAYGEPWSEYEGCYETVSVNGTPVREKTNFYKSRIQFGPDIFFSKPDGSDIQSLIISIIAKKDGTDVVVDAPLAFTEIRGAQVKTAKHLLSFYFDGIARLRRSGQIRQIKYETHVRKTGEGQVEVTSSLSGNRFGLVTTPCP